MEPNDFMPRKASMKEIRLRWRLGLHEDDDGNPTDGGIWFPDSPDNRGVLTIVMEEGNRVAGEGSHWLEEREA
jgi:hypothetical protein